ncbi:MAG: aldo/keto reductase [Geodermatophilaceae bacterium]|nr:aldo/keto reductase [Geodermatophilaceae bacterium]
MPATDIALPVGRIPRVGLGTWQLRGSAARTAAEAALQVGYRHIDTATMYQNEAEIGAALTASGLARDEVFLTTKIPAERISDARRVLEDSLSALGVDTVDLWLAHWPPPDIVGAWQAMRKLRDEGLARAIGVSNFDPAQIDELITATGEAPALNQIRWSPSDFDSSRLEHSRSRGVVLEGYSAFKSGALTSPAVVDIARSLDRTPAQVVLRWHIEHDVVVIPKSSKPERLASNFDVFDFGLSADQVARIDALAR